MVQESNIIAAIDIGTTKVVAIVGEKDVQGKMNIICMEEAVSTGVKRGVVLNIEETVASIKQVVAKIETKYGIRLKDVSVSIGGQYLKCIKNRAYRFIDGNTEITRFDIEQLYNENFKRSVDEAEQIIDVLTVDFDVDSETGVKKPAGMSGNKLDGNYLIIQGRKIDTRNIEKSVERAGLRLNHLFLEPLASSKAVLSDEEKEAGAVLVDIGGGTTSMSIFYDGEVRQMSIIPFGGSSVTNDIKEGCAVLAKQAQMLKEQYGSALGEMVSEDMVVTIPGMPGWEPKEISFQSLAYIIQARMEEIIDYVAFQIEDSGYYEKLGAGIVITGGGSLLQNLIPLMKYRTGLDVKMGIPEPTNIAFDVNELSMPKYSVAFGLLQMAYENPVTHVIEQELFSEVEREDPKQDVRKVQPRREKRRKERQDYSTGDLFSAVKKSFAGMFDDKDVEM